VGSKSACPYWARFHSFASASAWESAALGAVIRCILPLLLAGLALVLAPVRLGAVTTAAPIGPIALAAVGEGRLVVLAALSRQALVLEATTGAVAQSIALPSEPGGMVVRGGTAYVSLAAPLGQVLALDLDSGEVRSRLAVGHMPGALALAPDGRTLCVAHRFENQVRLVDLDTGRQRIIDVVREPVALVVSPDGARLFVANLLPEVRPFLDDEHPDIAAEVSIVDLTEGRVSAAIELPNGSQSLRGLAISPDGRHVVVTHILSRYTIPTWRIENGAMNRNVVSLIDTAAGAWLGTVVLDEPGRGAANPWAVAFSGDGRQLLVTHAGTHELSVIDFSALLARLAAAPATTLLNDAGDFGLLQGVRVRIPLPVQGPRALLVRDDGVDVVGYFSDSLARVDLRGPAPRATRVALGAAAEPSVARLGESYFHDASLCFQQWQSCSSCHPDARSDALYWDLLNDGVGNTKNTKSLLLSAATPPVMWRGVRGDSGMAVRAGIRHIQFAEPTAGQVEAIEAYLRSLRPVPSPALNAARAKPLVTSDASCALCHVPGEPVGVLSPSARRGKALFVGKAGCAECHPSPLYTNLKTVDPGLGSGVAYDVPSLIEVWRTAPYLHGGDALTLRETITDFNPLQKRGRTKDLTPAELDDLLAFLRSL
jgi:DNA-binding beta-propeller fold protein YncE/cytochrome c peroxidase